jgi:hypothetical protein
VCLSVEGTIRKVGKNETTFQDEENEVMMVNCDEKMKTMTVKFGTLCIERPYVRLEEGIALPWSTNFHASCHDSHASEISSFGLSLIASDVKTLEEVSVSLRSSEDQRLRIRINCIYRPRWPG